MNLSLQQFITESRNSASANIDTLSTLDMLTVINNEDKKVAIAVESILPEIAKAVDAIALAFEIGGRLIYGAPAPSGR